MRAVITFHHLGADPGPLAYPVAAFEALLEGVPFGRIGVTRRDGTLLVTGRGGEAFALGIDDVRAAWRGHLNGGTGEEGE